MKMYIFLFLGFFCIHCNDNNTEKLFLQNYNQKLTQKLAFYQHQHFENIMLLLEDGYWLLNYQEKITTDSLFFIYEKKMAICEDLLNNRADLQTIDYQFKQLLSCWEQLRDFFHSAKSTKNCATIKNTAQFVENINAEIYSFYQILAIAHKQKSINAWQTASQSFLSICHNLRGAIVDWYCWSYNHHRYLNQWQVETYIGADEPLRAGKEVDVRLFWIDWFMNKERFFTTVDINGKQFIARMPTIVYEFTPSQAGVQDLDIRAQVYKKNGDTVFLSKKIQVEVAE